MERINYIKPNKSSPGSTESGTSFEGPKSSLTTPQPKVYQKIELCRPSSELVSPLKNPPKPFPECDINKNVKIGNFTIVLRRDSSSSSGQCSVASTQQSDKSMIMIRKTYKKPGVADKEGLVMIRKTYKKKIFEPDIHIKRKLNDETSENKEEFYKYLGIDTKPPEKRVYRPEITNLDIFKRRSLRVRYLNIQQKTHSQDQPPGVQGKYEVKEEGQSSDTSSSKESPERKPSSQVSEKDPPVRPHDVKILRSYLKPKEKKTANLLKHQLEKRPLTPVVLLKPLKKIIKVEKVVTRDSEPGPVKYLMRSKINLSESRLRSGLQKKSLLRPSRYLSYFKNKRVLLRQRPRSDVKAGVTKEKPTKKKVTAERSQTPEKPVKSATTTSTAPKAVPKVVLVPVPKFVPVPKSALVSVPVSVEVKQEATTSTTLELPKSPVSQVPDSTVHFQTPTTNHHSLAIPAQVATIDTMTSSAHTLKNPLNREDGIVLFANVLEDKLVIVQERSVSFWRYSPFKHLVGVDQTWELIGRTKRHNYDIEIDCSKSDRICFSENNPIYIELRATRAKENENRQCPLSSVYVVVYSISSKQEFPGWTCGPVIKNFVQLDSVQSSSNDIHFIALPGTRYFIISWYQHLIQSKSSGLCKYSLTPDLRTLASIREFPHAKHNIYDLKCFEDSKLFGFGTTELSIWNHNTGDLLMSIDFKLPLGRNISIFEFKNQVINCMFLTQVIDSCTQPNYKSIKVLGINLSDDSWKVLKTHELPLTFNTCSKMSTADTTNIAICSIENGQTLLMMSKHDLHWIKFVQRTPDIDPTSSVQLFFNGSQVVEIGDNILIKSLDEFSLHL